MCAHPYGKDGFGRSPNLQYRLMRQTARVRFSAWTGWESPDPAFWCKHGYALVNCDLRGFGHSDGTGALLSEQEAQDYYDLIEWAGAQPWSSGRVGLNGVSYLALSQWRAAALRPPHLAAICPWEGFSDVYPDFALPGGIKEAGFLPLWSTIVRKTGRTTTDFLAEQRDHPLRDADWKKHASELERIEVPALICGSFSDHYLHSRGAFEGFRRIASERKYLYSHRSGKWAEYYSPESQAVQLRFFERYVKGDEAAAPVFPDDARVRVEVRSDAQTIRRIGYESAWPLPRTQWTPLYLDGGATLAARPPLAQTIAYDARSGGVSFRYTFERDTELIGPMAVKLRVSLEDASDAPFFVFARKIGTDGSIVPFEGSFGWGYDAIATGWLRLALRALDPARSDPWRPVQPFDHEQPVAAGEIVDATIELRPSATFFAAGEGLRFEVRSSWLATHRTVPFFRMAFYHVKPAGRVTLHLGGEDAAHLLVPVVN